MIGEAVNITSKKVTTLSRFQNEYFVLVLESILTTILVLGIELNISDVTVLLLELLFPVIFHLWPLITHCICYRSVMSAAHVS